MTDEQTTAPATESVTTESISESTAQATDTVITEAQTTENVEFGENTMSDTVEPYESEGAEDNAGCDSLITTPSFALFVIALGTGAFTIRKKEE